MIYVASSWRNPRQPYVVRYLRAKGFVVYDFRAQPAAFSWSDIDPAWKSPQPQLIEHLAHPLAGQAFRNDMLHLTLAQAVVLVLPCGRSAHLEAGYAVGTGKPLFILLDATGTVEEQRELMYKMATRLCLTEDKLVASLREALPVEQPLPGIEEMSGSIPNITGGLPLKDYLDNIRGLAAREEPP